MCLDTHTEHFVGIACNKVSNCYFYEEMTDLDGGTGHYYTWKP